jgi:hypothetical protein
MKKLLFILLLFTNPVFGQDSRPVDPVIKVQPDQEDKTDDAETNEGWVHLQAGVNFTTHYFSRGNLQENQGVIGQPWVRGELHLYKDPGNWVSDVHAFTGVWNSLHDGPTGTESVESNNPHSWYETKFTAGLSVEIRDVVAFSGGYELTISPNDRFEPIEELFVRGDLSDKSLWDLKGDWWEFDGLRLYGLFAWETFGQRDVGTERGVYAEVGIKPGITITKIPGFGSDEPFWTPPEGWVIKVSLPLSVGFNVDDYYEVQGKGDAPFGFMDLGLEAELPLPCINPRYGQWSLYVSGHWIYLDQNLSKFNNGEKNEIIGAGGVRLSY